MFRRPCAQGRSPLFSSFLILTLGFSFFLGACDKAPSKKGPEESAAAPRPTSKKPSAAHLPESHLEPDGDSQTRVQESHASAQEVSLPPPKFHEASSPEVREAFLSFRNWVAGHGGSVHAALVDLQADEWLVRADSSSPVNPASNAKILTAAAALELLGPAYQFKTELLGEVDAMGTCPRLVLEGGGAPDLTTADLQRLIRVAKGQGLLKVEAIVVDQSRFDDQYTPPAFEQQPKEWAPFRAPVSALALNENSISLNVVPTAPGEDARVWYDPPGIVVQEGRIETALGSVDRVTWSLKVDQDPRRPTSLVGGSLGVQSSRRRYARRPRSRSGGRNGGPAIRRSRPRPRPRPPGRSPRRRTGCRNACGSRGSGTGPRGRGVPRPRAAPRRTGSRR